MAFYTREGGATKTLQAVHDEVIQKYQEKDAIQEANEAKIIESFLYQLKTVIFARSKQGTEDALAEIDAYGELELIENITNNTYGIKQLFATGGLNFERVFARLQAKAYQILTDEVVNYKNFMVGDTLASIQGANSAGTLILDSIPKNFSKKLVNAMLSKVRNAQGQIIYKKVDQKVDNQGMTNVNISYNVNSSAEHALSLLATKNYSLKNYRSTTKKGFSNITEVTIGNTAPYRAITSVLYSLGLDSKEVNNIFFQGAVSISKGNTAAAYHFNHLQLIYEYSGAGQKLVLEDGTTVDAKIVDFLIINDPQTTNIQVISVKDQIYKNIHEALTDKNGVFSKHISFLRNNLSSGNKIVRTKSNY